MVRAYLNIGLMRIDGKYFIKEVEVHSAEARYITIVAHEGDSPIVEWIPGGFADGPDFGKAASSLKPLLEIMRAKIERNKHSPTEVVSDGQEWRIVGG